MMLNLKCSIFPIIRRTPDDEDRRRGRRRSISYRLRIVKRGERKAPLVRWLAELALRWLPSVCWNFTKGGKEVILSFSWKSTDVSCYIINTTSLFLLPILLLPLSPSHIPPLLPLPFHHLLLLNSSCRNEYSVNLKKSYLYTLFKWILSSSFR